MRNAPRTALALLVTLIVVLYLTQLVAAPTLLAHIYNVRLTRCEEGEDDLAVHVESVVYMQRSE